MVLNEIKDITVFSARPAPIILKLRIDVERRTMIVMERTKAFELFAGRVQSDIGADDIDYVVGFLDPLGQASPIVRQKTPVGPDKLDRPSPWPCQQIALQVYVSRSVDGATVIILRALNVNLLFDFFCNAINSHFPTSLNQGMQAGKGAQRRPMEKSENLVSPRTPAGPPPAWPLAKIWHPACFKSPHPSIFRRAVSLIILITSNSAAHIWKNYSPRPKKCQVRQTPQS